MKWSKLKFLVEANFSASLDGRVSIYSTRYGNCTCGHAWLTLDKKIIANFCTRAFWNRVMAGDQYNRKNNRWVSDAKVPEHVSQAQQDSYGEMTYGELSRQDAYQSCWEFVHDLSIEEAMHSDDALIQSLAMLDKRLGKRRLTQIEPSTLHPLAKKILDVRNDCEGIQPLKLSRLNDSLNQSP